MQQEKLNELIEKYQDGVATIEEIHQLMEWYQDLNYSNYEDYTEVEMLADSKIVKDRLDLMIEPLRYNVLYTIGETLCRTDFNALDAVNQFLASHLFVSGEFTMKYILENGQPLQNWTPATTNVEFFILKMSSAMVIPLSYFQLDIKDPGSTDGRYQQ